MKVGEKIKNWWYETVVPAFNDFNGAADEINKMNTQSTTHNIQDIITGEAPEKIDQVVGTVGDAINSSTGPQGESADTANGDVLGNSAEESKDRFNQMMEAQEKEAEENRRFNAEEAEKNRDFQREMRKTQYQDMMEDLEKAGINPTLLFGGGLESGGTPGGSTAHTGASNMMPGYGETETKKEKIENRRILSYLAGALAMFLGKKH